MRHHRMGGTGFTLLEMMVVLLIAGILLTAGVPMLQNFAAAQQLAGAADAFFHGVGLTRSAALRHGRIARMRPLDGTLWTSGWRIDLDGGVANAPALMTHPALPTGVVVTSNVEAGMLGYRPDGQPLASGSWQFEGGGRTRLVRINFVGRARICTPSASGTNSSCKLTVHDDG